MDEQIRQFALNEKEIFTHIDSVKKGERYFCINCKLELIPKRGEKRQHHFAHKPATALNEKERLIVSACRKSNESYLHKAFKKGLHELLEKKIEKHEDFIIHWKASNIGELEKNLLRIANSIKIEKSIGDFKPDLTLYDKNGKAYVAIEIVVDNKPSREKLAYYSENRITLYEIVLDKECSSALNNIEKLAAYPTFFSYIPNPQKDLTIPENRICEKCGETAYFSYLNISTVICPYCMTSNRIAYRSIAKTNKKGERIRYYFDKHISITEKHILDMHGFVYNKENGDFLCINESCKKVLNIPIADNKENKIYPLGFFCQKCQGKKRSFQNRAEEKWAKFFDENNIEYEYVNNCYIEYKFENRLVKCKFSELNPYPIFYLKKSSQIFRANKQNSFEKDFKKAEKLFEKTGLDIIFGFENGNFCILDEYGFSNEEESILAECKKCGTLYFTNINNRACKNCNYYADDNTFYSRYMENDGIFDFEQ